MVPAGNKLNDFHWSTIPKITIHHQCIQKLSYAISGLSRILIMLFHLIWLIWFILYLFFSVDAFIIKLCLIFWLTFFECVKRKDDWKMIWNISFYSSRLVLNAIYYSVCNNVIYSCGCVTCYESWFIYGRCHMILEHATQGVFIYLLGSWSKTLIFKSPVKIMFFDVLSFPESKFPQKF